MWVEKYRPATVEEMVGNEDVRVALVAWLRKWKKGAKAALLVGPPGTGKTTLVHLVAEQEGVNLIELNASDTRTKGELQRKIGEAMATVGLFGERPLIFLDEVDGLAGRADYGAIEFIKDSIKATGNPIVMAANFADADQVERLSDVSLLVRVKPPPPRMVEMYLRQIARKEGLEVAEEDLRKVVLESSGDIRHAINSLQSLAHDPSSVYKDRALSLTEGVNAFFEAEDSDKALTVLRRTPIPPMDKSRLMMRSVVKSKLSPEKMADALRAIADADVLMGAIMRTQNWRTLRYMDETLANGLSPAVRGARVTLQDQDLPFPVLLRIWNDSKKVKEMAKRYSEMTHTSAKSAAVEDMPYLFAMCGEKKFRDRIIGVLGLEDTFEKFLEKEGRSSAAASATTMAKATKAKVAE